MATGKRFEAGQQALLDATLKGHRACKGEAARELCRAQRAWQLTQRERVAPCLEDQLVAHPPVDGPWQGRAQQSAGVLVVEAGELQLREVREPLVVMAYGDHHRHSLGGQSPGHRRDRPG